MTEDQFILGILQSSVSTFLREIFFRHGIGFGVTQGVKTSFSTPD